MHPIDKYLDQKGAAASPPPPLGVSIHLGVHCDPPESRSCPGAAPGFRGSTGTPPETSIYPEYRKVSGVHILQVYFHIIHN